MHKALDGAPRIVADRVVALGGIADELSRIRHELAGDRIGGVAALDELGQRRRETDRIALGDSFERPKALRLGQARFDKVYGAGQAAGWF